MGKKKFTICVLISICILLLLFYGSPFKKSKEISSFYHRMGFHLPKKTSVLFSDKSYGALGDGYRLYIYQISSKDMEDLLLQKTFRNWFELPLPSVVGNPLLEKIKGITNPEITNLLPFEATSGYYTLKNFKTNRPISSIDVFDFSYNDVFIGIINLENNKLYFFEYSM